MPSSMQVMAPCSLNSEPQAPLLQGENELKKSQNKEVKRSPPNTSSWSDGGPNKPLELPSITTSFALRTGAPPPSLTSERLPKPLEPQSPEYVSRQPAPTPEIEVPVAFYVLGNSLPPFVAFEDAVSRLASRQLADNTPSIPYRSTNKH
jgi:hypothetical protein